jgi:adenylate cyclase
VADVVRSLVGEQLSARLLDEGGRLPEERRLVTALFADLSGFTPLAGRLDPESLAAVVDPVLEGLVRVVARHEGHVGSFAGDALLAFFGAPVAHEDDAERALRAALEMLEEFPALLASTGPDGASLRLRIGVDTGSVMARLVAGDVRTDYSVMGNAVNMAQRLQSQAPPGRCWLGETTARLTEAAFELAPQGLLQVKGRDEPLPAWELVGERSRAVMRRAARVRSLVGRSSELARVTAALEVGPARGLLLRGEPGAGKSRLVEAARELTASATWLEGGCAAHDRASAYRPWRPVLAALDAESALDAGEDAGPAAHRRAVAVEVATALRAAAPAVVALEDLHWADTPSLELLDDLLHDLGDADVLVLATSRTSVATTAELPVVDVAPLSTDAVRALVEELLGGDPPAELVEHLARRSGGNPLYTAELALALEARGVVRRVDGDALVAAGSDLAAVLDLVPDSLEGLVGARIDALPSAAARVLTVAAVLGEPVRPALVGAVVARAGGSSLVEPELAALDAAGLLAGDGFVHAVVQDTAYARTPRRRRRELHLAAADAGPGLVPPAELPAYLAHHLYLAGAGARAVAALQEAADLAAARSSADEAVLHLHREVELRRADPAERAALPDRLTVLGELLELLGRYAEAEPVLREALELGADARAVRALAGCVRRLGRYDEAIALADPEAAGDDQRLGGLLLEERGWSLAATGEVEAALALVEGSDEPRQQLLAAYCLMAAGEHARAAELAEEAAERLPSDDPMAARAQRVLGDARELEGDLELAERALRTGIELGQVAAAWEEVAACTTGLAVMLSTAGRHTEALAVGAEARLLADRLAHGFGRVVTRANIADFRLRAGLVEGALESATEAMVMAQSAGLPGLAGAARGTAAECLLALGRLDAAEHEARLAAAALEDAGQEHQAAQAWDIAARAARAAGRRAEDAEGAAARLNAGAPAS